MSRLENFKCPNCGGALEFDSESQKLSCPHCDGKFDPETFDDNKDIHIENETWNDSKDIVTFTCKSCGGEIITSKDTVSLNCPYCNNPMVLSGNVEGDLKPKKIIPFKYDKKQAKECYRKHLEGKVLLPKQFKDEAIIDEIKGIYVPYWIFDGKASGQMWFNATRVRTWSDINYHYTETSNYKLYRAGKISFSNLPVDASSKVDDNLTQSIEPFDIIDQKDFNTNYLAGYMADKYDIQAEQSKKIADRRVENSMLSSIESTALGFASCIPVSSNVSISEGQQTYVMYPLWLLNIKYKDKQYNFAMNGQTGKFVGNLPTDNSKMFKILALVFIKVAAVSTLVQYLII